MSGYVYRGEGLLIAIDDPDEFVCSYNELTGTDHAYIDEIENGGDIGDWCSSDIVEEVWLNGEELSCGDYLVIRGDKGDYGDVVLDVIAEALGWKVEELIDECEGEFYVSCNQ